MNYGKKNSRPQNLAPEKGATAPALSQRRLWQFRFAALLLPIVLAVILEAALRLGGYGHETGFFKPIKIGGEDCFVQNEDFSLRFFPRETARFPGALRMRAKKAPGTFRIFIFGESAAMGDPEPAYGAGRCMEMLLREKFPGTKFEVVNVAFTAISSHVILPIARECAAHEGDAWIIYMGNNEMVGPFGAATVFGAQAPPLIYVRLVTGIQKTRVGQLFMAIARKISGRAARSASWGGMQMFLNNQIAPDSPRKPAVYENFRKNLNDILRAGLGAKAKIILNTVAVNLKDSPPFASLTNTNLSASDLDRFENFFTRAKALETQGDFPQAAGLFAQAAALQPLSADSQFQWAACLLAETNFSAAREHFHVACDNDALPFRADSRINAAIRAAGKKAADANLTLFDAADAMAAESPAGICGKETFFEHVHFDFEGSYRLGLLWAKQVEKFLPGADSQGSGGWASPREVENLLGLSDWNRSLVIEHMIGRLQEPPFSRQSNAGQRLEELRSRLAQLRARMNSNAIVEADANFKKQLARVPDDFNLHENYAVFLQATGDLPGAVAQWEKVHDLIPQDCLAYFQLGRLQGGLRQWTEAEANLRESLKMRPSLTEGWVELGNVLASQGKFSEALTSYAEARRRRPQDAQTILRMGKIHAMLDQHAEAMQFYRDATQANPDEWEPHYELAGELDAAGQLDEALKEFGLAAKLNPDYSRAHFNHGVLLAKLGHLEEARREFEEAVRLEPGYKNALDSLAKIKMLEHPSMKN